MDKWVQTKQLPLHFVSAAGLVYKDGKILLIRSETRGWEFPGGIVEQGEAILDGLRREILEESGIEAEPETVTGIYQNLTVKNGYGPLEGVTMPSRVHFVFRCRYVSGTESITEEALEAGWFAPDEGEKLITHPYIKKAFQDSCHYSGKYHFCTYRNDQQMEILSDCLI